MSFWGSSDYISRMFCSRLLFPWWFWDLALNRQGKEATRASAGRRALGSFGAGRVTVFGQVTFVRYSGPLRTLYKDISCQSAERVSVCRLLFHVASFERSWDCDSGDSDDSRNV